MSDALVLGIVTATVSFLGTVFTGIMAYLMARLNKKQDDAAAKVAIVAQKQDEATEKVALVAQKVAQKVDEVHVATNGITDRLIAAAALASELKGAADERERGKSGHD